MQRRKERTEFITGLDIGSSSIRVAVGQYTYSYSEGASDQLQIIGVVEVPSEGLQRGVIVSIEDTVSAISSALEKVERLVGMPIEHVWVGVSGVQVITQESRGVVAIGRSDGEISQDDIDRVVDAARTVASPLNYEVLHLLPKSFCVDGQMNIKDPVGMTGVRLEVDTKIIYGLSSHIKNISKAVYRAGVDIDDFVLTILASSEAVTSQKQKGLGVALVNIGGPTTSLAVYEDGDLTHTAVVPIGSSHITNDLALGLKTSIEVAEQVKIKYGRCVSKGINKKDVFDLVECGAAKSEIASHYYVAQIIEARVREILEKIDGELLKVGCSRLLPAGVAFIGGGAKINGLVDIAKDQLGLPASLGHLTGIQGITDKVTDISFIPAVGLVKWGASMSHGRSRKKSTFNVTGKVANKVQRIFKLLIP